MKKAKKLFFFVFLATIIFSGCSKEEELDLRDEMVGTYNYRLKFYLDLGELVYLGSEYDEVGTMIVKKNNANPGTIDFFEGGELGFQGTKIIAASNGIAFDIPSQSFIDEGESFSISGYEYWDLSGTNYHGAYVSSTKKIQAAFQTNLIIENEVVTFVYIYEGTKQ